MMEMLQYYVVYYSEHVIVWQCSLHICLCVHVNAWQAFVYVCVCACVCMCGSLRVDAYICTVFCLLQDGCVSLSQRIWRADFALSRQMLSALSQLVWARLVAAPAAK